MEPYYSGRICPKCAHNDIASVYEEGGHYHCPLKDVSPYNFSGGYKPIHEHIDRTCRRCHHQWGEAVLTPAPDTEE